MMFAKLSGAFALSLLLASPTLASTLKFTATANSPTQSSDFTIIFDDADGDQKLSADEVVSFSGFTSFQLGRTYSELLRISPVPAETDEPQTFTSGGFAINTWLFGEGTDFRTSQQPSGFTYQVSPVPVPAAGLLMIAALGAVMGLRRRG